MNKSTLRRFPICVALCVAMSFMVWSFVGQETTGEYTEDDRYYFAEIGRPMPFAEIGLLYDNADRLYVEILIMGHSPSFKPVGLFCDLALLVTLSMTSASAASWIPQRRCSLATALGVTSFVAIEAATRRKQFVNDRGTLHRVLEFAEYACAYYAGIAVWIATLVACSVISNLACSLLQRVIVGRKTD